MSSATLIRPRDDAAGRTRLLRRAHLVGIAGSGMRALANVLDTAGWTVSGSDPRAGTLGPSRFAIASQHRAEALDPAVELVVYSDAVPQDNPELVQARRHGMRMMSYPQMLGCLMQSHRGAAIAGTHGKSTTTAMAGQILAASGSDPTVVYGAEPIEPQIASRLGRGRWMLAEACEYRANFRHLAPQIAVVLDIELDHVDSFASLADVERAFAELVRRVPASGLVLAAADCAATQRATAALDCPVETFGFAPWATWQATAVRERRGYYSFELRCRRRRVCDVSMAVPGRHNVHNALAAAALASHCGATATAIRAGLERFAGLRRRLELLVDNGRLALIDDYAHHPTEISAALATVRQMYPGRRVWGIFEPHQASRTARLLDEFAQALHNADKIVVTDIFAAREEPCAAGQATAHDLVDRLGRSGADAEYRAAADIEDVLHAALEPGDVVVALGAGDIGAIAHELGQRFRTIRKAG